MLTHRLVIHPPPHHIDKHAEHLWGMNHQNRTPVPLQENRSAGHRSHLPQDSPFLWRSGFFRPSVKSGFLHSRMFYIRPMDDRRDRQGPGIDFSSASECAQEIYFVPEKYKRISFPAPGRDCIFACSGILHMTARPCSHRRSRRRRPGWSLSANPSACPGDQVFSDAPETRPVCHPPRLFGIHAPTL